MTKTLTLGLSLCALAVSSAAQAALPPVADRGLRFMPYEVVAKFQGDPAEIALDKALSNVVFEPQYGGFHIARIPFRAPMKVDQASVRAATLDLLETIRARKDVVYAQPNYLLDFALTPNDPLYPLQWHYQAVQLPNTWDITTGSNAVRIAIVDSGNSGHPDIQWSWQQNIVNPSQPPTDNGFWRHGTHVAAIAGGRSNNGMGGAGVCSGCTLMNAKIGDTNDNPTMATAASAIIWSADYDARVVNMSFETAANCQKFPVLVDATRYASIRNVSMVAAAGNNAQDVANVSPASCPGVISVAATDRTNRLAEYSSYGPSLGIAAPGGGTVANEPYSAYGRGIGCPPDPQSGFFPFTEGVVSAWTTSPSSGNAHCYRYLSGTSMAAPHVTGTIGLMLSVRPQLRPTQVKQLLASSATAMPECGANCGPGRLNAYAAVLAALSVPTGPCSAANDDGNKSLNCHIDTIDRYTTVEGQYVESVTAYGFLWEFDANGSQLGVARNLRSIRRYAEGPCQFAPAGEACRFQTRTVVKSYHRDDTIEFITAYGRVWGFRANGAPFGDEGVLLSSMPLYFSGPCAMATGADCRFDTRHWIDSRQPGEMMEYVTANQQYWIYDNNRTLMKTGMLIDVPRYREGPCNAVRSCTFETQEFYTAANGGRSEVVTAHGRYYEWDTLGNPSPYNGMSLRDIPRMR
jgi:subtilisin family serine protease